jgi:hypothetical protein
MVQSISGGLNGGVSAAFRVWSDDYGALTTACSGYNSNVATDDNTMYGGEEVYCGVELAKVLKKFLTYSVQAANYKEFSTPSTSSALA